MPFKNRDARWLPSHERRWISADLRHCDTCFYKCTLKFLIIKLTFLWYILGYMSSGLCFRLTDFLSKCVIGHWGLSPTWKKSHIVSHHIPMYVVAYNTRSGELCTQVLYLKRSYWAFFGFCLSFIDIVFLYMRKDCETPGLEHCVTDVR